MRGRTAVLTALAALAVALTACEEDPGAAGPTTGPAAGGEVLVAEPLVSMAAEPLRDHLGAQGFDPRGVHHGVDAYRIVFRTTGAFGEPTVGSGIVAFPQAAPGAGELPVTTYLHGTNPTRAAAASLSEGPDRAVALLFAGAGQATVAPDYPGLGLSAGAPAYMLPEPTVQAALDGVRAARAVAEGRHTRLEPRPPSLRFAG